MSINFIPNDPNAQDDLPLRQQPARPDRPRGRADFNFDPHQPEGLFDFGTTDFLFWQSREAALAAVEAWEGFAGNLAQWADRSNDRRHIDLSTNFQDPQIQGPQKLNAFYDGTGVRFFGFDNGTETIFSGNSTDTVSHEVGHALLDSVRPELFGSNMPEVPAFHEAFGDCVAMLTALADRPTRQRLLQVSPDLSKPNFVEAGSEYLSAAILKQFGNVSPSKPRRALNQFQWQLPSALPAGDFNDPPELLSREPHSFSRVFTGCIYDLLRSVFNDGTSQDEAALLAASRTVGSLLAKAARNTPQAARYFQEVGRGMVTIDQTDNGGANRARIGAAFAAHGVLLGSAAMLAPTAALEGPPPKVLKTSAKLSASTVSDLKDRIRAPKGAKFALQPLGLAPGVAEAVHRREVPLGDVDKRLKGVVAYGTETVLVGASGPRAALLGALPEPNRTEDEVTAFVETLVRYNRIAPLQEKGGARGSRAGGGGRGRGAVAPTAARPSDGSVRQPYTHIIRSVGGKKVLTRVRFLCP